MIDPETGSSKPLYRLVSDRGFDRYQPGLRSRWVAHRLHYEVEYHRPGSSDAFLRMKYTGEKYAGDVTAFPVGTVHLKAWETETEKVVYEARWKVRDEDGFHWYMMLPVYVHYLNFGIREQAQTLLDEYKSYMPEQSARFGVRPPDVEHEWQST